MTRRAAWWVLIAAWVLVLALLSLQWWEWRSQQAMETAQSPLDLPWCFDQDGVQIVCVSAQGKMVFFRHPRKPTTTAMKGIRRGSQGQSSRPASL